MNKEILYLKIDGTNVKFTKGQTILEAAKNAGIYIPTLCYIEGLTPYGGCRLCIVKIEGMKGYSTACSTPAQNGMIVITKDEELQNLRREILKLILSEHPYSCIFCDNRSICEVERKDISKAGRVFGCFSCSHKQDCELRKIADYLQINDIEYELEYKNISLKRDDPFIEIDSNMCILCGKCVRTCNELREIGAINFANRGHDTKVSTAFDLPLLDTNCQFCGACVDVCPTGALTSKNTKWFDKSSKVTNSICGFCGRGCSFNYFSSNGMLVESIPNKENLDSKRNACLFGRFCTVPFNNGKERLKYPLIKKKGELIPSEWDEAYTKIKENLARYDPDEIAILASSDLSNETAYILNKFAHNILQTDNIGMLICLNNRFNPNSLWRKANSEGVFQNISYNNKKSQNEIIRDIEEGQIKALYLTERIDNLDLLKHIEFLIIQDIYPSDNFQYADIVLPTTTFVEYSGSFINSELKLNKSIEVALKPGKTKLDWQIFCELAKVFDNSSVKEFEFSNSTEIFEEMEKKINSKNLPEHLNLNLPLFEKNISECITKSQTLESFKYRGEKISNQVADLKNLIEYRTLREGGKLRKLEKEKLETTRFKVNSNYEIALNIYKMVIEAPLIAKKAKPGNFIIIMKDETSERIPLTISDWDASKGTITIFFQEAGYSTKELTEIKSGDYLYSVVGPLGNDIQIEKFGTVLLAGGCYGNGAIYPIAKAMKLAGNKVIVILEAKNENLFYLEKEFEEIADQVIYCTSDGSKGLKGKIQKGLAYVLEQNIKIDRCFFIGCIYMMRDASNFTKEHGNIPTFVSLNTIMIDGTGMCGSCRLSLTQEGKQITKFACIDGPTFNGHLINWDELLSRSKRFKDLEISIYQKHSCKAIKELNLGEIDE